jgi:outer membrane protein assembly factor BamB
LFDEAAAKGLVSAPSQDWPWGKTYVQETRDTSNRQAGFRKISSVPITQRWQHRPGSPAEATDLRLVFDTGISPAYVRDGSGEVVARLPQLDSSYAFQNGATIRAIADGHLLFASLGGQVLATAMLRTRARDDDSVLWREPLLPIPTESGTTLVRQVTKTITIPFDSQPKPVTSFEDGANRALAVTGPMTRSGVCFQKIRTLTCVDPLTGKTVWSRQDLDHGLELFGDEEYVFAVQRGEPEAFMLDAIDGRLLGKRPIPPAERRWHIQGRKILAWEEVGERYRLFVFDAERQQDIWSELLPRGTRGCLVEHDGVAMLQPDGRFWLRSLHTDQPLVNFQLPLQVTAEAVRVRASSDQWLVIINDNEALPAEVHSGTQVGGNPLIPVNGHLFAFDRRDGSPLWQSPALVRGYGMLAEQPDDLPTLWFVRQYKQGQANQSQSGLPNILCLDRRTGSSLLESREAATLSTQLQIVPDTKKREVSLVMPQVTHTIRFTDEARPPEPPAQLSHRAAMVDTALERFGDIISAVTGSLLPAAKPAQPAAKAK